MPEHVAGTVHRRSGLPLLIAVLALLAACAAPPLRNSEPDQRALLIGPLWITEAIDNQLFADSPAMTVAFYGDRRIVGKAPCGAFTGRYRLDGAAISISDVQAGKSDCAADLAARQQGYLAGLAAAVRYEIQPGPIDPGGVLLLSAADGRHVRFRRDAAGDIQVLDYACEDGAALRVIFNWAGGTASISTDGGTAATLRKADAPTGFRFEKAPQSFAGTESEAQWSAAGAAPVACRVAG